MEINMSPSEAMVGQPPKIRDVLEHRKTILETELQNINEALNLMDTVPNFDDIFDAVRKAGF